MKDNRERLEQIKILNEIFNLNGKGLGGLTIDEIKILEKLRQVLVFSLKENHIDWWNKMKSKTKKTSQIDWFFFVQNLTFKNATIQVQNFSDIVQHQVFAIRLVSLVFFVFSHTLKANFKPLSFESFHYENKRI